MAWRSALLRDVEAACEQARELLSRHFASIEDAVRADAERRFPVPLHDQNADITLGTKPLAIVHDGEGRTYIHKRADPALLAAEEACWLLRRLGGRPAVPAVLATINVDGVERSGLLKPYVDLASGELGTDTTQWTALQRAVMLREHAWEHWLENLDANTTQYAMIGPEQVPVNIDWDRAFATTDTEQMSRFLKYKPILPNARTFLYADYVEGRIDLPLDLLAREARRIRRLPTPEVRAVLRDFAKVRFTDAGEAHAFVERSVRRKRDIEVTVARFIRELHNERARIRAPASLSERLERWAKRLWDQWQVVLHVVGRGPLGTLGRRALKLLRGRRLRAPVAP